MLGTSIKPTSQADCQLGNRFSSLWLELWACNHRPLGPPNKEKRGDRDSRRHQSEIDAEDPRQRLRAARLVRLSMVPTQEHESEVVCLETGDRAVPTELDWFPWGALQGSHRKICVGTTCQYPRPPRQEDQRGLCEPKHAGRVVHSREWLRRIEDTLSELRHPQTQ